MPVVRPLQCIVLGGGPPCLKKRGGVYLPSGPWKLLYIPLTNKMHVDLVVWCAASSVISCLGHGLLSLPTPNTAQQLESQAVLVMYSFSATSPYATTR